MRVLLTIISYYAIVITNLLSPSSKYLMGKKKWYWPLLIEWDILVNSIRLHFTREMHIRVIEATGSVDKDTLQSINGLKFKVAYLKSLTAK